MPFYYDTIYWIVLIPVLLLSVYAQARVSGSFSKYSQVKNRRHITGAHAAYEVLVGFMRRALPVAPVFST